MAELTRLCAIGDLKEWVTYLDFGDRRFAVYRAETGELRVIEGLCGRRTEDPRSPGARGCPEFSSLMRTAQMAEPICASMVTYSTHVESDQLFLAIRR